MGDVNAQDMQLLVIGDWVVFLVIGDQGGGGIPLRKGYADGL